MPSGSRRAAFTTRPDASSGAPEYPPHGAKPYLREDHLQEAGQSETGPADGLIILRSDGRMYVTSPRDDAVKVRDLSRTDAGLTVLVQDERLRWPDTFSEGPDGTLYVTTSHIQDSAFEADAPAALPTES